MTAASARTGSRAAAVERGLHDADWFVRTYRVVVHEHCERPIGTTHCDHFAGTPVRDGYEALDRLMETWTHDDPVDCTSYACLE